MSKFDVIQERIRFEQFCMDNYVEHSSVKNSDGTVLFYYNAIADLMWKAWLEALKK